MESFIRACAFLALCALAAFAVTDPAFAKESSTYTKAMTCKVTKDASGTFDEIALFTHDGSFKTSGTALIMIKGGSPDLPTMKTEVAQTMPILVQGDTVSLDLAGTDQAPGYTVFSARELSDTFLENTPPLKLSTPSHDLEMECRSPMQNPFLPPRCGIVGPDAFLVHGGLLEIRLLANVADVPISRTIAEKFVKKSEAVARHEISAACEHVTDKAGGISGYDVCYGADSIGLQLLANVASIPLCTRDVKQALERAGNASESGSSDPKRVTDSSAPVAAGGLPIADDQKAVR